MGCRKCGELLSASSSEVHHQDEYRRLLHCLQMKFLTCAKLAGVCSTWRRAGFTWPFFSVDDDEVDAEEEEDEEDERTTYACYEQYYLRLARRCECNMLVASREFDDDDFDNDFDLERLAFAQYNIYQYARILKTYQRHP